MTWAGLVRAASGGVTLAAASVDPAGSHGFAGTIAAAFVILGLLALIMVFVSSKPRNRRPR